MKSAIPLRSSVAPTGEQNPEPIGPDGDAAEAVDVPLGRLAPRRGLAPVVPRHLPAVVDAVLEVAGDVHTIQADNRACAVRLRFAADDGVEARRPAGHPVAHPAGQEVAGHALAVEED